MEEKIQKQKIQERKDIENNCNALNLFEIPADISFLSTVNFNWNEENKELLEEVFAMKL